MNCLGCHRRDRRDDPSDVNPVACPSDPGPQIDCQGVRIGTELDDAIDGARFPVTPKFKLGPGAPNEARSVFDPLLTRISVGSEGNALRVQARDEDDQVRPLSVETALTSPSWPHATCF